MVKYDVDGDGTIEDGEQISLREALGIDYEKIVAGGSFDWSSGTFTIRGAAPTAGPSSPSTWPSWTKRAAPGAFQHGVGLRPEGHLPFVHLQPRTNSTVRAMVIQFLDAC